MNTLETGQNNVGTFADLGALDTIAACDKPRELELIHPTTKKAMGIFISLLGKDSTVFRNYLDETRDEENRRNAEARRHGNPVPVKTQQESRDNEVEALTVVTTGWRSVSKGDKGEVISEEPILVLGGEKLSFNVANCKRVYAAYPTIKDQVDSFVGNLQNFM